MTILDVEATRLARLLPHLKDSPDVVKLNQLLSGPAQDTIDVCEYILTHLHIDSAEGFILDFWGGVVGVKRPKKQELPENIFTLRAPGYTGDLDGSTGFYDDSDPTVELGGYMTTKAGLESITEPGVYMGDDDFRKLIMLKAKTFRTRMTRENLWEYLYMFGARCRIDDDTERTVRIDPATFYDFDEWHHNYIEQKGFKPAGIKTRINYMLRDGDSI